MALYDIKIFSSVQKVHDPLVLQLLAEVRVATEHDVQHVAGLETPSKCSLHEQRLYLCQGGALLRIVKPGEDPGHAGVVSTEDGVEVADQNV